MTRDSTSTPSWEYRISQNPRWFWLVFAALVFYLFADSVIEYATDPGRHTLSYLPGGIGLGLLGLMAIRVGGYTQFQTVTPLPPNMTIPSLALWSLFIPMLGVLVGIGTFALLEYLEPHISLGTWMTPPRLLITWVGLYGVALGSLLVRGYRRQIRFTPASLEYGRGWFSASIPWNEIVSLSPVCDANLKSGGAGDARKPGLLNLRAGVQLTVGSGATTKGLGRMKGMMHRDDNRDVIHIDCSDYRIDPNTLINALYLLTYNPELRTHLDHPAGVEIFAAPNWNTRRRMRVGDTWDRTTNEIIASSAGCTA